MERKEFEIQGKRRQDRSSAGSLKAPVAGIGHDSITGLGLCRTFLLLFLPILFAAGCSGHPPTHPPNHSASHPSASHPSAQAPTPSASAAAGPAHFRDVTRAAGISFVATDGKTSHHYFPETMGSGVGFIDYDRDGWQDILFVNGRSLTPGSTGPPPTLHLYHNDHDGTFTDVTKKAGLDKVMYGMGVAVGDYDNDGYDDIYVSCVLGPGHLYHNNRNGTFTDVTSRAGVDNAGMWGTSCSWVDVDRDGWLDLFVCNYVVYSSLKDQFPCYDSTGKTFYCLPSAYHNSHCALFHNNRDGTFKDISRDSGIAAAGGKSLGVAVWDYDGDGLPDLYVANDTTPGFLFHNLGHSRFREMGVESGVAFDQDGHVHSGMGIDVGDISHDGTSSMVVTNFSGQETSLYREIRPGMYRDAARDSGVGPPSINRLGFSSFFFDYDNDSFNDIFVANGHVDDQIGSRQPGLTYAEPPMVYHNNQKGSFAEIGRLSGPPFDRPMIARGAACGDYDNDGKLDIVISTNGGPGYLWHNEMPAGSHWLTLRLVGTRSNRDAIGARIRVTAAGSTQFAEVRSGSGYLSAMDLRQHFGLANAATADVQIDWPSGSVTRLASVAADQILTVTEGAAQPPAPLVASDRRRSTPESHRAVKIL